MKFTGKLSFVRTGPRKARYVIDMVRGKGVNEALYILSCVHRRPALYVRKLLQSVIANADQHGGVNVNDLVIAEITVDGGPMLKRFRPGPMGRAMRIRKRTSHINIVLSGKTGE